MKESTKIRQRAYSFLFTTVIVLLCLIFISPSTLLATGESDVDSDGVNRSQELLDGTNSNNADSFIERGSTTYCVDWNGFLGSLKQVLELRNAGCSVLSLRTQLRDIAGNVQNTLNFTLSPSEQFDLILNDLSGFEAESYGTVCSTILSGDSGTLSAQLSVYDLSNGSFRFAYAAPFIPGRTGSQYLGYNHIFPSLNPAQRENFVAGFIQISNEETSNQSGKVIFSSHSGTQLKEQAVSIAARGRVDIDTHSIGANSVGMIEWRPNAGDKKFRVVLTRYYFAGNSSTLPLVAAVSLSAKRGSGYLLAAAFDTTNRITAVELSNTLLSTVEVAVTVYNAEGEEASNQPGTITIPAKSTRHMVLNESIASGIGKVAIEPNTPQSVVATLLEYQLNGEQSLSSGLAVDLKAGFGANQRASYNNFLGSCRLRLANISSTDRSAAISMKRYDGTTISIDSPVAVPADSVVEVDICSNDTQSAYGEVVMTPQAAEVLTGNLIRMNSEGTAELSNQLVEQSICSANIAADPASLSLVVGSNTPQSFTITNNSSAVTATAIEATLPDGWDVIQDASDCASVAPGDTCELELTPGATVYGDTNVSIRGTNTQQVDNTVSVDAPTEATITVTGSPLTLSTNGPTGTLTINNTSLYTAATNITADFTGTALDGNVTETGNTCASLAPASSCTLTFTPGSTVVSETNFPIQGGNTNALTAAIEIESSVTLDAMNPSSGAGAGGVGVTLTGTDLTGATGVTFGGVAATSVNVVNSTTVTLVTPAHAAGAVDVVITTPDGSATLTNGYTYLATAVGQSAYGGAIACLNGGLNNLIAATADNGTNIQWGGNGIAIGAGAQSNTDGASNTAAIVSALGNNGGTPYSAKLCNDYEVDSQGNTPCEAGNTCYNDWFLPAGNNTGVSGQLNCLYTNRVAIGGFGALYYSSTESSGNPTSDTWTQFFPNGGEFTVTKNVGYSARCVRAFTP